MPLAPENVATYKREVTIPAFVFEAWDYVIAKNYCNGVSEFPQSEVVDKIIEMSAMAGSSHTVDRKQIGENRWLDVEDCYRQVGWKVEYDRPAYNETYEASFKFTARKGSFARSLHGDD